jgi:hypothetical protein
MLIYCHELILLDEKTLKFQERILKNSLCQNYSSIQKALQYNAIKPYSLLEIKTHRNSLTTKYYYVGLNNDLNNFPIHLKSIEPLHTYQGYTAFEIPLKLYLTNQAKDYYNLGV